MVRVPLASAFGRSRDVLGMLDARIQFLATSGTIISGVINGGCRNTTCGTGVSHVEDQPKVADSMWADVILPPGLGRCRSCRRGG